MAYIKFAAVTLRALEVESVRLHAEHKRQQTIFGKKVSYF